MANLKGALEIKRYLGISESTLILQIQNEGLPAKKISGEWTASTKDLDKWRGVKEKAAEGDAAAQAAAEKAAEKAREERAEADAAEAQAAEERQEAEKAEADARVAAKKAKRK